MTTNELTPDSQAPRPDQLFLYDEKALKSRVIELFHRVFAKAHDLRVMDVTPEFIQYVENWGNLVGQIPEILSRAASSWLDNPVGKRSNDPTMHNEMVRWKTKLFFLSEDPDVRELTFRLHKGDIDNTPYTSLSVKPNVPAGTQVAFSRIIQHSETPEIFCLPTLCSLWESATTYYEIRILGHNLGSHTMVSFSQVMPDQFPAAITSIVSFGDIRDLTFEFRNFGDAKDSGVKLITTNPRDPQ